MYAALLEKDSRADYMKDRSTDKDLKELIVRPEWYGADADGLVASSTKNRIAIQAAIDSFSGTSGGVVRFSPGIYIIDQTINTAPHIMFEGSGKYTSNIYAGGNFPVFTVTTGNGGGIVWDNLCLYGDTSSCIKVVSGTLVDSSITNCWFRPQLGGYCIEGYMSNVIIDNIVQDMGGGFIHSTGGGYITINNAQIYDPSVLPLYFEDAGAVRYGVHLSNVIIEFASNAPSGQGVMFMNNWSDVSINNLLVKPVVGDEGYTGYGLYIANCENISIDNLTINGALKSTTTSAGLLLDSCTNTVINNLLCTHSDATNRPTYGMQLSSLTNLKARGVISGATTALVKNVGTLTNCEFALDSADSQGRGYDIGSTVSGVRFAGGSIKNTGSADADKDMVYVNCTGRVVFDGTVIDGSGSGTYSNWAVAAQGGTTRLEQCILTSGAAGIITGSGSVEYQDLVGYPTASRAFADGDSSPSVAWGNLFVTVNSAPTIISMFDGGTVGKTIRVIFWDANTTIDFTSTGLKGNAGVDWVPANGDWLEATFEGTNWYCSVHDCTA